MIHSVRFTVVLDTNVVYPVVIRDLLFWFAHYDLYTVKWSRHIFDEWRDVMQRKSVATERMESRIGKANTAFPDALVCNYEPLIETLTLPDEKDRHVLAAAIKADASLIVTHNLKDFPDDILELYGVKAKSPDDFLTDIIDLNGDMAVEAFKEMVQNKRNPELDEYQMLNLLRKNGLAQTADYLHALI